MWYIGVCLLYKLPNNSYTFYRCFGDWYLKSLHAYAVVFVIYPRTIINNEWHVLSDVW